MKAIRARGLVRSFGSRVVVDRVDVSVASGEIQALVGLNGAGKTTLWRLLSGLLPPSAGSVELLGIAVESGGTALRRELGVVPDVCRLFEALTGRELLLTMGRLYGLSGAQAARSGASRPTPTACGARSDSPVR